MAESTLAGENNTVNLLQSSTDGIGNTLSIDQSGASNSLLAGPPDGSSQALQIGGGNQATLTIEGDGGQMLLQQGTVDQPGFGNTALAMISGLGGLGTIIQDGSGNSAEMQLTSNDALQPATGSIGQFGNGNNASLNVFGANVNGEITQQGNNNTETLTVNGSNTSVSYTQVGNGMTPTAASPGVSVFTTAGSVSITQTQF
ncbi:hypothetical protein [Salinihabitans flavidus]|uniref:hypothetical protein n=1 Tax=Salinihabitans flavidus TaxID=569882 RepID=UPI0011138D75|nr:hypothetical protein [Salinihabitans flavidus]